MVLIISLCVFVDLGTSGRALNSHRCLQVEMALSRSVIHLLFSVFFALAGFLFLVFQGTFLLMNLPMHAAELVQSLKTVASSTVQGTAGWGSAGFTAPLAEGCWELSDPSYP